MGCGEVWCEHCVFSCSNHELCRGGLHEIVEGSSTGRHAVFQGMLPVGLLLLWEQRLLGRPSSKQCGGQVHCRSHYQLWPAPVHLPSMSIAVDEAFTQVQSPYEIGLGAQKFEKCTK